MLHGTPTVSTVWPGFTTIQASITEARRRQCIHDGRRQSFSNHAIIDATALSPPTPPPARLLLEPLSSPSPTAQRGLSPGPTRAPTCPFVARVPDDDAHLAFAFALRAGVPPDRHLDGVSIPLARVVTRVDAGGGDDGGAWGYVVVVVVGAVEERVAGGFGDARAEADAGVAWCERGWGWAWVAGAEWVSSRVMGSDRDVVTRCDTALT